MVMASYGDGYRCTVCGTRGTHWQDKCPNCAIREAIEAQTQHLQNDAYRMQDMAQAREAAAISANTPPIENWMNDSQTGIATLSGLGVAIFWWLWIAPEWWFIVKLFVGFFVFTFSFGLIGLVCKAAGVGEASSTEVISGVPVDASPSKDPLFSDAVSIIRSNGRVSARLLQDHLGIDYNRASDLLADMEKARVISKPNRKGVCEIL